MTTLATVLLSATLLNSGTTHHYRIVPGGSRIVFDAKSTLHDFSGTTTQVFGGFRLDWENVPGTGQVAVRVATRTLATGSDGRDEEMHKNRLESAKHPALRFESRKVAVREADPKGRRLKLSLTGPLALHGVTRDVTVEARLEPGPAQGFRVRGEARLNMKDFGITPPTKLLVVRVDPEVTVRFDLKAEAIEAKDWAKTLAGADLPVPPVSR